MICSVQLEINGNFCLLIDRGGHGSRASATVKKLSSAALHEIIVENKFQPPINELCSKLCSRNFATTNVSEGQINLLTLCQCFHVLRVNLL